MNQVATDLWPILMAALVGAIGWQWRENHALKTKVAVLEKTVDDLQKSMEKAVEELRKNMEKAIENIQKDIEAMKKRQDSHSKKQDEIVNLISDFRIEMVQHFGEVSAEVKTLSNTIACYDEGVVRVVKKKK